MNNRLKRLINRRGELKLLGHTPKEVRDLLHKEGLFLNQQPKQKGKEFEIWCMKCYDHVDVVNPGLKEITIKKNSIRKILYGICPKCNSKCNKIVKSNFTLKNEVLT